MLDRDELIEVLTEYMGEGSVPPGVAKSYAGECASKILALIDPVHEAAEALLISLSISGPIDLGSPEVNRLRAALSGRPHQ